MTHPIIVTPAIISDLPSTEAEADEAISVLVALGLVQVHDDGSIAIVDDVAGDALHPAAAARAGA